MTEKYTDACNTLRDLTGKLKTIQDNYAVCQKQAKGYDERAKAAMSRGDASVYQSTDISFLRIEN